MAISKEQFKAKRKFTTGKVRCSFVNVFKARTNELSGNDEYGMELMIPKSDKATVKKFKEKYKLAVDHKFPNGKPKSSRIKWHNPLRDADEDTEMKEVDDAEVEKTIAEWRPETKGHYLVRVKNFERVPVVDTNKEDIVDESDFQSGDYARCSLNVHPFKTGESAGVTFYLNAVQVLAKGEPLGSSINVDEEFDEWDDAEDEDEEEGDWDD